jgi:hypothetical protein
MDLAPVRRDQAFKRRLVARTGGRDQTVLAMGVSAVRMFP